MIFTIGLRNPLTNVTVEADHMITNGETVRFVNGDQFGENAVNVALFRTDDVVFAGVVGGITDFRAVPVISHVRPLMQTDEQRIRDRAILNSGAAVIISPAARIGLGDSTSSPRRTAEVAPVTPVAYPDPQQAYPPPPPPRAWNSDGQEERAVQENLTSVFETADRIVARAIDNSILDRIPPVPDLPPPGMVRFRETVPATRDPWTY